MANVLTNQITASRIPRNKRFYSGTFNGGNVNIQNIAPRIDKTIIPFTATDFPNISDYSIYEDQYGQYPSIELYTYDENNNVISRAEKAIFNRAYDADTDSYKITDINFGALSDGNQTGYMKLMI